MLARVTRRRFDAEYKARIVREADACSSPGHRIRPRSPFQRGEKTLHRVARTTPRPDMPQGRPPNTPSRPSGPEASCAWTAYPPCAHFAEGTLVRLTSFVKDKRDYLSRREAIGESYRAVLGHHDPAMSFVQVSDPLEDGAIVEIEATAALP